jgi:hypothetical protein
MIRAGSIWFIIGMYRRSEHGNEFPGSKTFSGILEKPVE